MPNGGDKSKKKTKHTLPVDFRKFPVHNVKEQEVTNVADVQQIFLCEIAPDVATTFPLRTAMSRSRK